MNTLINRIEDILAYDPNTRGLKENARFGYGLGTSDLTALISELPPIIENLLQGNVSSVAREIGELIRYRAIFMLLPEECLYGEPKEDKPIIREHLIALGLPAHENVIRAIKFICGNYRSQKSNALGKASVTDVYIRSRHVFERMHDTQNGRCCICGDRLIYGENMQLDHIVPWHLGDDPTDGSNWQLLCEVCNRGKGVFPYYSLQSTGVNWIKPTSKNELREDVRYAALVRDGRCVLSGKTPKETRLKVVKKISSGCWIFDNVQSIADADTC